MRVFIQVPCLNEEETLPAVLSSIHTEIDGVDEIEILVIPQERIGDLVQPILKGAADIVIADRQTRTIAHFSGFKKLMKRLGSHIVNKAAETELPDAAFGSHIENGAAETEPPDQVCSGPRVDRSLGGSRTLA